MAESLYRDDPLKTASIRMDTPEATFPFKRIPFFMWNNREFEAYLAEMSSQGFFLKQGNETQSKFEWERGEPQQCVYRLLLGAPKLEISLIETLRASGWRFVHTEKNQTQRKNDAFHIFVNSDISASDRLFRENNRKMAALLNPLKESLLHILKLIVGIGLFTYLLDFLNRIYMVDFHRTSLFAYGLATIIYDGFLQYHYYKAESYFARIHLDERQSQENEIPDWRKSKSSDDQQLWQRFAAGLLGGAVVFAIVELL